MDRVNQNDMPAALTPDQALALLGKVISRATFYAAINRGEVPHRRIGKRIIIPRLAFLKWLESTGECGTDQPAA